MNQSCTNCGHSEDSHTAAGYCTRGGNKGDKFTVANAEDNKTEYVTWVTGYEKYRGADLEAAIREWDASTFSTNGITPGGISVQTWQNDIMVRDGWILHVYENGQVFLNPNIR